MSLGLLLPGQGSQHVGMGRDLADAYPEARRVFEEADEVLGFALSRLCWDGPLEDLTRTKNAQSAILIHSVAVWRLIEARVPGVRVAAGHSLGEFSAHVCAGSIGFADAVRTVRWRGKLMYEAGTSRPGSMAAVLGVEDARIDELCAEASTPDAVVVAANYNAPGQVVISGDVAAVERASELLRAAGAKRIMPLNVSGAFHSPLMKSAEAGLREHLQAVEIQPPRFPVVSNVTAEPVHEAADVRRLLVQQLTAPVRWTDCVHTMAAMGATHFLEVGPAHVLTKLLKRSEAAATGRALGTVAEVETFTGEGEWS